VFVRIENYFTPQRTQLHRSDRSGRNRNTRNRIRIGDRNRNLKPWYYVFDVRGPEGPTSEFLQQVFGYWIFCY
jgi:hypothetical protein